MTFLFSHQIHQTCLCCSAALLIVVIAVTVTDSSRLYSSHILAYQSKYWGALAYMGPPPKILGARAPRPPGLTPMHSPLKHALFDDFDIGKLKPDPESYEC